MLQVLGRLHPLLVHFPIALLLAALVAELLQRRKEGPSEAGFFCLALGALGALAAALTGWLFAEHDPPGAPALLFRHRWSGVGVAVSACATLVAAWRWRASRAATFALPTRLGLALTAALVAASAHLGGEMVYGEGFALEPLRKKDAAPAPLVPAPPPASPDEARAAEFAATDEAPTELASQPEAVVPVEDSAPTAEVPAPVDYLSEIVPLFRRRCYECHGDRKRPKGNLRLTDLASVLARDPSEAALVPGDPGASLVYQRITLPAEHEDVMPPEDGPLAPAEIELVRRWIAEGAPWSAGPAPSLLPGDVPEDVPAAAPPPAPLFSAAELAARDAALLRLQARGARAAPLAREDARVEVDLGVVAPPAGDAELLLLSGLEPFLVELSLARSAVSDAGLAFLSGFRALRKLRLEHTTLGSAALAPLAELPALESLNLFGTRVGDEAVPVLARLPKLARLYTGEARLGDAALDELARLRPGLVIERGHLPRGEIPDAAPR